MTESFRIMAHRLFIAVVLILVNVPQAGAQDGALYVAQPGQVLKLMDHNGDGDFLDFAETTVYAEGLPADIGAIDGNTSRLFVVVADSATILVIEDLNADGDALDFSEVALYAALPEADPPPILAGLACHPDGILLTAEQTTNAVYRAEDLNGDGDALDLDELFQVADGLSDPSALAARPDSLVLLAQQLTEIPVRILHDRTNDGDYQDFAENISYAEDIPPGDDITAPLDHIAYMTRPAQGLIVRLQDLTGDDDVLDYAEVVRYAENLSSPTAITHENADSLFVTSQDAGGSIYHIRDLNADGDALDFAEVVIVAEGLGQMSGIVYVAAACVKGDINGTGTVSIDDVPPFVEVLLGTLHLSDPCPADMNNDGQIDGADIQSFIDVFLP